ncbi:MAG: amidase family protein [Spirochaetaceae bacterium]
MQAQWNTVLETDQARETYRSAVESRNRDLGAFLDFKLPEDTSPDSADPDGALEGLPVAVKDNIAVEDRPLTCGSRLLERFQSPYDATAVTKLREAGACIVGKTALDEFGMGSATDTSALLVTRNPWDSSRTAGGSSGGSAVAVAAGMVPVALGSDTGGSVRQPASFCGVYGLKPTYGAVSRFGLVAYASSLDTIGVVADTPDRLEAVFSVITGADGKDQTSLDIGSAGSRAPTDLKSLKVGVLAADTNDDPAVQSAMNEIEAFFRSQGTEVEAVSLSFLDYASAVYYTIATAEAGANLARFDGVRYGERPLYAENPDELVRLSRSAGLGDEVKLRILLGTYVLRSGFHDQYYGRAQRLRARISREMQELFTRVDLLVSPVFPTLAFPLGSDGLTPYQRKQADRYTTIANLAGVPALALPTGVHEGIPAGVQLTGPRGGDFHLIDVAKRVSQAFPPAAPPNFPRIWS